MSTLECAVRVKLGGCSHHGHFGQDHSRLWPDLCIVGRLASSLARTHEMPVEPQSVTTRKVSRPCPTVSCPDPLLQGPHASWNEFSETVALPSRVSGEDPSHKLASACTPPRPSVWWHFSRGTRRRLCDHQCWRLSFSCLQGLLPRRPAQSGGDEIESPPTRQ